MCRQRGCGVDVLGEGRRGPWGGCVGRGAVGGRCPHAPCPRRHRAAPAPPVEPGGGAGGAQRAARGEEHPGGRAGGAQLGATCGGGDPGGAVAGGTLGLCQAGLVPPAGGRGLGSPDGPPTPQGAGETGAPAAAARPPAEGVRGGDTAGAIAKYSPHVVSFALGPSAGGEPAGQDGGLSGTTSPSPASLVHHLEPLKDKLSVSRIHQARAQLRAAWRRNTEPPRGPCSRRRSQPWLSCRSRGEPWSGTCSRASLSPGLASAQGTSALGLHPPGSPAAPRAWGALHRPASAPAWHPLGPGWGRHRQPQAAPRAQCPPLWAAWPGGAGAGPVGKDRQTAVLSARTGAQHRGEPGPLLPARPAAWPSSPRLPRSSARRHAPSPAAA
ncbi:coiled-coil domain-containing protein 24 isoform X3 [Pelodiscus sinensis]|uniref:coiled-coil domain-containing protein 24 isoform X3 n=1 Tax=Pelodiscus sinensis TaxID=13735 RepID=UPI003F6D355E